MRSPVINCPIFENNRRDPLGIAIRMAAVTLTWREFEMVIRRQMDLLARSGLKREDRVAILAANSGEYAATVFASIRLGLVLVPLNLRLGEIHWREYCEISNPGLLLVDREREPFARSAALPWLPLEGDRTGPLVIDTAAEVVTEIDTDSDALIIFTSGSSGHPRGVISSFGSHLANARASNLNLSLSPGDCWLLSLPLFHVGGLGILLRTTLAGASVNLQEQFDARAAHGLITRGEITHLSCVPTMLQDLLVVAGDGMADLPVKGILVGGASVGRSLMERCRELKLPVLPTYGMTEAASQIATLPPGSPPDKLHTAGKSLSGTELMIADRQGSALPPGETGEILIRGATLCRGYMTDDTDSCFTADDWFATGDLGSLDNDGFLVVLGRKERMLISGGENIHPARIEAVAGEHPTIQECAVIAVPHPRWGQRPVLYVLPCPADRLDHQELALRLQTHLPKIMWPDRIIEVDLFPRLATGKIDRLALERRHGVDMDPESSR
jgi:o-succinylbenzoate---CoA ligase